MLQRFKRTEQFTPTDFDLLGWIWCQSDRIVTIPHILTEVSNLCGQTPEKIRVELFKAWRTDLQVLDAVCVPSRDPAGRPSFPGFGSTDVAVEDDDAAKGTLVPTDDLRLAGSLGKQGLPVVNFTHIRFVGE